MSTKCTHILQPAAYLAVVLFAASSFAYAQDSPAPPAPANNQEQAAPPTSTSNGGWRRVGDPPPPQNGPSDPNYSSNQYPQQGQYPQSSQYPQQRPNNGPNAPNQNYDQPPPPQQPIPAELTIKPGTFVVARINQRLSSDKNQPGDAFSATLVQPLVVDGVVVAEPGQTVAGSVVRAEKNNGNGHLGIRLNELSLVDGQQIPIQSQLVSRSGPGFTGRDAGTIVGTTGIGAVIGGAVGWGTGAAIGAGVGALAGVLVTHDHPSVIYPESVLTFRIDAPVTISTEHSAQAFHYIEPNEYNQSTYAQGPPPSAAGAEPPPPVYYGYPYPYYAYGYPYWGPTVGFYWGPGYWGGRYWGGGRYYYGHGWYGHGYGGAHFGGHAGHR